MRGVWRSVGARALAIASAGAMCVGVGIAVAQQPVVDTKPQPGETQTQSPARAQPTQPQQSPPQQSPPQSAEADLAADLAARATTARTLAHLYADRLRQNIVQALKEGGPVRAIDACSTIAPDLNATVADGTTFEVARTAFRVRNPDNAPDAWEQAGLESFQKSIAAGADVKSLEIYEIVPTKEGQRLFRYLRPITMREPCLVCHGTNVAADVKAEIAKSYPDDKALGFNLGELRGAFSIVQQLD